MSEKAKTLAGEEDQIVGEAADFKQALEGLRPYLAERRLQLAKASLDRANHSYDSLFHIPRDPGDAPPAENILVDEGV